MFTHTCLFKLSILPVVCSTGAPLSSSLFSSFLYFMPTFVLCTLCMCVYLFLGIHFWEFIFSNLTYNQAALMPICLSSIILKNCFAYNLNFLQFVYIKRVKLFSTFLAIITSNIRFPNLIVLTKLQHNNSSQLLTTSTSPRPISKY